MRLLRLRDSRGFDLAYQAYAARLHGFLRRLSGRRELADDLFQQAFLRLAERGPDLRPDSDLGAWLFAVARNAYYDFLRSLPEAGPPEALEALSSPSSDVEARLLMGDVERALAALRPEDRELLLLVGVEGLDRATVAGMLSIDPVTLRQRIARARSRLLSELERAPSEMDSARRGRPA